MKIKGQYLATSSLLRSRERAIATVSARSEFERRHQRVLELKRLIGKHFWQMGAELKIIRNKRLYRAGGYKSFEEYLASPTVKIDRSTAYDWIGIVESFSAAGVGLSDIKDIDWGKLRKLRRVVREHPEQAAQWLAQARTLSRVELQRELKKAESTLASRPSPFTKLQECVRDLQSALGRGDIAKGIQALRAVMSFAQQLLGTLEKLSCPDDPADAHRAPIQLGWQVLLWDESQGDLLDICLVANGTADVEHEQISDKSPVGAALLGRCTGEEIKIRTPSGRWRKYRILQAEPKDDNDGDNDTDAESHRDLPLLALGAGRGGLEEP